MQHMFYIFQKTQDLTKLTEPLFLMGVGPDLALFDGI